MIRVDINEQFPIVVQLVDEQNGVLATGETVHYDIRDLSDNPLSPPASGTLVESTVEGGIYRGTESIATAGRYIVYATCSGFLTNTEDIIVNSENIYELTKQNRHYNISVEDIIRTNVVATASQTVRKVGLGQSDYTITRIKQDTDTTWSGATTSGVIYAWYRDEGDCAPYKMGDPY